MNTQRRTTRLRQSATPKRENEERKTVSGLPAAFTMIEVLVAMTVLAIMVLMAANIFQGSSASWNIGTQKADMNTAARAALDYMVRELESAVAGPVEAIAAGANPEIVFDLRNGNDVRFVSLLGEPGGTARALQASLFRYKDNILQYHRETASFNPYTQNPSWSGGDMLITNVLSLQIIAFTNEYGLVNGLFTGNFNTNQLPICVDIGLEMLSNDDMFRYRDMNAADQPAFLARNAKLYSTRVYFPNRKGYGGR